LSKKAIQKLVEEHTRESGVRSLEKRIAKVVRSVAKSIAMDEPIPASIEEKDIARIMGPARYLSDKYENNETAGVVTGLAWTAVGGDILFIEVSLSKSPKTGGKLTLTGNLGDVMKESAVIALEYLKSHNDLFNIPSEVFNNWNIHIHVPEGATPKDGPSAGITMLTALTSAFTQRKVKANLAMTGEITLRGKVLPVGGIKEKILAAKRAGIHEVILCAENRKDIEEIKQDYLAHMQFHYVTEMEQVIKFALTDEKVNRAIDLQIKEEK
jgi:ATP-dependent Lon protease